jgi:hypothetical protein
MSRTLIALALTALVAAPAAAQFGLGGGPPIDPAARVRYLENNHRQIEMNLRRALQTATPESPQVRDLQADLARAEGELAEAREALVRGVETVKPLGRPVNVRMQDATVRQAAETLSKAAGIPIRVDAEVPEETRLTLQARGVDLGSVLQAVGKQANLKIGREEGAIVLTTWPMIAVNEERRTIQDPMAPWGKEWQGLPGFAGAGGGGLGGGGFGAFGGFGGGDALSGPWMGLPAGGLGPVPMPVPGAGAGQPVPGRPPFGAPGMMAPGGAMGMGIGIGGGMGMGPVGMMGGGPPQGQPLVSLTTVGDRLVVVAEPGPGPKGEPGFWLTLYRLEGTQLRRTGSTFHRSAVPPGPAAGMGMPGAYGGMMSGMMPGGAPPQDPGAPGVPPRPAPRRQPAQPRKR